MNGFNADVHFSLSCSLPQSVSTLYLFLCVCVCVCVCVSVCLCVCARPCVCPPPDEVYAQKLKGKALSEELDLALNDMTTL